MKKCLFCGKACDESQKELFEEGYCSAGCKRANECRYCRNKRKEGVEWYDDNYCSGKCKKADGGEIEPAKERSKTVGWVASLEEYKLDYPKNLGERDARGQRIKGRKPKRLRRRFEPERLNWGTPLSAPQLKQAGLRCNRKPIPGDFDFEVVEEENGNE